MKIRSDQIGLPGRKQVEAYQRTARQPSKGRTNETSPGQLGDIKDRVELSPRGREYHGALEEARRAPDVRADRVAAAVESLRRGEGSSREAARKLLDESVDLGS